VDDDGASSRERRTQLSAVAVLYGSFGADSQSLKGRPKAAAVPTDLGLHPTSDSCSARPSDTLDSLENVFDVHYLGPRIHHDQPQNPSTVEYGRTDIAVAALIQFFLDLPVNPVGVFGALIAKPKAQDVRMGFVQGLKNR